MTSATGRSILTGNPSVDISDVELATTSQAAATALGMDYAGVDLMPREAPDGSRVVQVIEVNGGLLMP